jgi:hypothetical protein
MADTILEALKKRLFKDKIPTSYTDNKDEINTMHKAVKVNHDSISPSVGFMDEKDDSSWSRKSAKVGALEQQADLINEYRRISDSPEGRMAIDEIVNEAIFTPNAEGTLTINVNDGKLTEKTCEKIIDTFNDIEDIFDIEMNIGYMFEKWYVDGQLAIQIVYDNNNLSGGIIGFNVLETKNLFYNKAKKVWQYANAVTDTFTGKKELKLGSNREYSHEEVIFISSELYEQAMSDVKNEGINIIKSHLHNAIKSHNQLTTLEDMLIPMRFSRSVSRRVFNVDVGDLPASKAESELTKIKDKFKYKKFYDVDKGTISNQMHIASLVEDYWFQSRDGSKGTNVETLDESGNLGEIGDIQYFKKKLYSSLKIPQSRVSDEQDGQNAEFDYGASAVSREEIKFFAFIQKLRRQFLRIFRDVLKRQLIYTGIVASEAEWNEIRKHINIKFSKENIFLETMNTELLSQKIALYGDIEEMIGVEFSKQWVRKNVLKMSDEEIEEMDEQMASEKEEGGSGEDENKDSSRW